MQHSYLEKMGKLSASVCSTPEEFVAVESRMVATYKAIFGVLERAECNWMHTHYILHRGAEKAFGELARCDGLGHGSDIGVRKVSVV